MSVTDALKSLNQFFDVGGVVRGVYMNRWHVGLWIILALAVHVKCRDVPPP